MPDEHLTSAEAVDRLVESAEDMAESIGAVGDFFASLDVALQEHPDSDRASFASFLRAYRKASAELEAAGADEENGAGA